MDKHKCALTALGVLWVVALGVGMRILLNYENSSGLPTTPPPVWPANSKLQRAQGRPTLVVIAHPHCPCTRATIGELALIMARLQHQVSATGKRSKMTWVLARNVTKAAPPQPLLTTVVALPLSSTVPFFEWTPFGQGSDARWV